MKKNILLLLSICLLLLSCSKEIVPSITLNQTELTVSDEFAIINIPFESNVNWSAKSSERWCTVSPAFGNPSTKSIAVTIYANQTYDARSCNITISVEGLTKTLTINQNTNLDLFVIPDRFQLNSDTATIEVAVEFNTDYDVIISDGWITEAKTRGLSSSKHQFAIAKNESYDNRVGSIIFKQTDGKLQSTVKVYQSQVHAIFVSNKSHNLSSNSHTLEMELKTNVDFEVIIPEAAKNWVSYTETRALRTETLLLTIAENEPYDARSTEIYVKDKFSTLQDTITINQSQKDAINFPHKIQDISSDSRLLEVELNANVDFEVIIPEADKNWVSYAGISPLKTKTLLFNIAENKGDKVRSTVIYLKNNEKNLQDTLTINQFEHLVYYVRKKGTLGATLNQTQKDTITTMIVRGELNKADFDVMKLEMPKLMNIDLKEVKCDGDKIPDEAFGGHQRPNYIITKIILPLSINTIGKQAFDGCSGLTGSLVFPTGLTSIGQSAFGRCQGLSGSLNLPESLIAIGNSAFSGCSGFTGSLILPEGLTTIGGWAFANCGGFTGSLTLPDGLTSIGEYTFYSCTGFSGSLNLPEKLTTIESAAFEYCNGFTGSLELPKTLTTIDYYAFRGCSGFTGLLTLPEKLTTLGSAAFMACTGFTGALSLPDALTSIADYAFHSCKGFTELTLGNKITTINEYAFYQCGNISGNVVFPQSLISIEKEGFNECDKVAAFKFPHTTPIQYKYNMLPNNSTVEVPLAAVETYKAAEGWNNYNIVGY